MYNSKQRYYENAEDDTMGITMLKRIPITRTMIAASTINAKGIIDGSIPEEIWFKI